MACQHHEFAANVTVNRLEDSGGFHAELRIECAQCHQPFEFIGLPVGLAIGPNGKPTASFDGLEARMPIRPRGTGAVN